MKPHRKRLGTRDRTRTKGKNRDRIVILGAGPAGLAAGYYLGRKGYHVTVIEQKPIVGGLGASLTIKDNTVDYGPHSFHLKPTVITELFEELVGRDSVRVTRKAKIWLKKRKLSFPLSVGEALLRLPITVSIKIVFDFVSAKVFGRHIDENQSFESFGLKNFGRTLYRLAFGNYSEKMWGLPGAELSAKLARQKLQNLNMWTLMLAAFGLLSKEKAEPLGLDKKQEYDAYPRKGIGIFFEKLADDIQRNGGQVLLSREVKKIALRDGHVSWVDIARGRTSERFRCDALVSTIPIPSLSNYMEGSEVCSSLKEDAKDLTYRDLICVYLVLDKDYFSDAHWIYLLDDDLKSNRLSEQKNLNPDSCRPGTTILSFDITSQQGDLLWNSNDSFLIGLAIADLEKLGVNPRTILDGFVIRTENAYPVYRRGFESSLERILGHFSQIPNLFSVGRHGLYLNNDIHDSMEMGYQAAEHISKDGGIKDSAGWYQRMRVYIYNRLEGRKKDPIDFNQAGPSKN
jgi:protoporphyrinogen oxidase